MTKAIFFFFLIFSIIFFSTNTFAQNHFTDFENFVAGEQLACQDTINWTTWNLSPCNPVQDAYITTNYSFSGTKSFVVLFNNDEIKLLGNQTSGKWYFSFYMMIPSGKEGYFSLLSDFWPNTPEWAMEIYFYDNGLAHVNAGIPGADFTFNYDVWFLVEIIIDLQEDTGEIMVNDSSVYEWPWTLGLIGNGCALRLAAAEFWGYIDNEMYVDNLWFSDSPLSIGTEITNPSIFFLEQNYPNPFNPSTTLAYLLPMSSEVALKVYDLLGKEVATLVNEYKPAGSYEVEFDGSDLISGVYFYQLRAVGFVETKKMLLLK